MSGFLVQMLDITAQGRSAEALHRAKALAEAATRAKSDFLARMSHDIRTPTNGVIGMAELTMQTPLSFEQGQYLSLLRSSATSLLSLVNDVLDFSNNEAGRLTLEEIGFSLRSMLEHAAAALRVRAAEKDLFVKIEVGDDVSDRLTGDPQRLPQTLVNLLANVVKFTSKGGVPVKAMCDDIAEGHVHSTVGLQETGIGISAAEKAKLF